MVEASDRVRSVLVVVFAVAQALSSPLTSLISDSAANQGAISDANLSPVTPAGYAFSIWGLIYIASLALAVYQVRPSQLGREVHRRTGWWLAGAFAASTLWVPVFGNEAIWVAQLILVMLVICLIFATVGFSRSGPAEDAAEQFAFRLPITLYLGWATVACCAGFGTTFRSLGMPQEAGWASDLGVALVLSATIASLFVIGRLFAVTGFVLAACWALFAVAVATYSDEVRLATVVALDRAAGRAVRPDHPERRAAHHPARLTGLDSLGDLMAEVWRRATSVQPIPPPAVVALTAAVAFALVLSRAVWPYTRMLVTITHEAGHAVAALVAGRRLQGIRLHSDTSGLTVSSGRASGPGMVAMLLAGYLAPALVGSGGRRAADRRLQPGAALAAGDPAGADAAADPQLRRVRHRRGRGGRPGRW